MSRKIVVRAAAGAVLTAVFVFAVSAACFTSPCDLSNLSGIMDGTWNASTLNGHAFPTPDPSTTGRILHSGSLTFKTTRTKMNGSGCQDVKTSSGTVLGVVTYDQNGIKTKRGGGSFDKDHATGVVTLHAAKVSAEATSTASTLRIDNTDTNNAALFITAKGTPATIIFVKQ